MPLTPFHLGPALFFGIVLGLNLPTILISSIILDLEPFFIIIFKADKPLHGFSHTFLGSSLVAILLSALMKSIFKNERFNKILISSLLGVYLHIIFDSPLYADIKPFYPIDKNPIYGAISLSAAQTLCIVLLFAGFIIYLSKNKKLSKNFEK